MDSWHKQIFLLLITNLVLFSCSQLLPIVRDETRIYIVTVVKPEGTELLGDEDLESWHRSFLPNTSLESGDPRLVYSYRNVMSGFAARLTSEEAEAMASVDGFVHAELDREYQLETTHTPEMLGLVNSSGPWPDSAMGEGIIIGVFDSGIPKEPHASFGDHGMSPPPSKWTGTCDKAVFPPCNNKIIGAVRFLNGSKSYTPIDIGGHGTHVASIAAGNFVDDAEFRGLAKGVASGMAPRAHLAIYKVCNHPSGCMSCDVLKGIDQAIDDGVDVINMSFGANPTDKFFVDNIAKGSLAAVSKNISAVTSAGNIGPKNKSLSHSAPWVLVVGGSTTDRRTGAVVRLGNGMQFDAHNPYQPGGSNSSAMTLPLEYPGNNGINSAMYCSKWGLSKMNLTGKVVLCLRGGATDIEKGKVVKDKGGSAMILIDPKTLPSQDSTEDSVGDDHVLPVCTVSCWDFGSLNFTINK